MGQASVRRSGVEDNPPSEVLLRQVCCRAQGPRNRLSVEEVPGFASGAAGHRGCAEEA